MSGPTVVLLLAAPGHWLRFEDDALVAQGEGAIDRIDVEEGARVVAVVPGCDVVIHQLVLADLTDAQARGAARLALAENSMAPVDTLHVAAGADTAGERTVVAIAALRMAGWLDALAALGFDPDAMLAAPLILPRPESGALRADLGGEIVMRGRDAAFTDDPALTPLLTNGEIVTLDRAAILAALAVAAAKPEVDLRQGVFARRRRWLIDRVHMRRIAWLAAACAATLLVLPVVELIHLTFAARRVEAENIATAQAVLPPGTAVLNPVAQLDERLAALGGGDGGFMSLAAAVADAAKATSDAEFVTMAFDGEGGMRVNARATSPAELAAFETRLAAAGLMIVPAPIVVGQGRPARDFTVRVR